MERERATWLFLKKYIPNTHFLYEILQNADDAKANSIEFILDENELLMGK